MSNTPGGIIWVVLMVGAGSGFYAWRRRDEMLAFLREKWPLILIIEGLFLLAFVVGVYLRSFTPEIAGTEKPMDFAFLNASTISEHFAPNDPWLSGHTISYYYGGYFLVAMTGKLANVPASSGYNLGLAMIAALAVVGAFGLVYNLATMHEEHAKRTAKLLGAPLIFGLAAAILLTVIGNLEGLLEFLAAHGIGGSGFWNWVDIKQLTSVGNTTDSWYPTQHWWWWRAARIVSPTAPETITEFPFFSFLLGDLHPHVMAIPFGLLGIAAAVRLLQEDETLDSGLLGSTPTASRGSGRPGGRAVLPQHLGPADVLLPARGRRVRPQLHRPEAMGLAARRANAGVCRAPGHSVRAGLRSLPQSVHPCLRIRQPGRRHRARRRQRHDALPCARLLGADGSPRNPVRGR